MIYLNYLGKMGQLGNQLFQYASLKGIAKHNGYDFAIPNHNELIVDALGNKLRIELFFPFKLKNLSEKNIGAAEKPVIQERHFHFDEELFNVCPDECCIVGYFQTEKYFSHIRDELLEDFEFIDDIQTSCREMISQVEKPIALHIRRGDFLRNSGNHYNLDLSYYESALSQYENDRQVVIFSDDPVWCKKQSLFKDDRFLVSESDNPYVDLCLMSMCSDFIIANSTFSWWGAWLSTNPNKKIIAPTKWFGPNNQHHNTKDLFPDEWVVL
jgi:hypothetical protein